jgi:hypothetical protein
MIARRDVLKWGVVAPALVAGPQVAMAGLPQGLDALLLDQRFAAGVPLDQRGVTVLRFAGDVTKVWFETIDPAWRKRGFVLGGITGPDALFVLETLAHQQGRRVVSRNPLEVPGAAGLAPISWIIAPHHPSVLA